MAGDGDCCSRCGSVLMEGHESWHEKVWVRVVMKFVRNEEKYLDPTHLQKVPYMQLHGKLSKVVICLKNYIPGKKIHHEYVRKVFR